jgi:phage gp37-like protein
VRVVQVYRDREAGRVPARALREALAAAPGVALEGRVLPAAGSIRALPRGPGGEPAVWVLWLGAEELSGLEPREVRRLAAARRVYLSARLAGSAAEALAADLRERLRRSYRVRAWMRSRGVALSHERLQLATHFALSVADFALGHLVDRFSREYFLERVEHEAERALDPGLFPHLALGPGQRVASKGCYVLRPDPQAPGGLAPDGGWIVP